MLNDEATNSFVKEIKNLGEVDAQSDPDGSTIFEFMPEKDFNDEGSVIFDAMELEFNFGQPAQVFDVKNPYIGAFDEFRKTKEKVKPQIYKEITKAGVGSEVDIERLVVTYEYAMFLESSEDPFDSSQNGTLGVVSVKEDKEPLPGCYLALTTMKQGEESWFLISYELMFGKLGCPPRIPPFADILFKVKIIKVEDPDGCKAKHDENAPFTKVLRDAMKKFKIAGDHFKMRDFQTAITTYRSCIKKLESVQMSNNFDEDKQKTLLAKIYQNLSCAYLHVKKPEKTCIMIKELERLESIQYNPKALMAKAKAKMMLHHFDEARRCAVQMERISSPAGPVDAQLAIFIAELNLREEVTKQHDATAREKDEKFRKEFNLPEATTSQQQRNQEDMEYFDYDFDEDFDY